MNAKAFLVDALTSALDLGLATPDDIVRHVTADVLAAHLPRPLWARLLTACVGAPERSTGLKGSEWFHFKGSTAWPS